MNIPEITYCPSSLQPGFSTYSPASALALFGSRSKKVSHILPFGPPGKNSDLTRQYNEKRKFLSISGVQEKYSLKQVKKELILTASSGTHILKPISTDRLERVEDMPANEHVTMQIASQIFRIKTAACGLIFFEDGSPAYITRRFDYKSDGTKYQVEDFATLLGKSPEKEGEDYKYNASYLDIANLIVRYVPASPIEMINFFRLIIFNYLIGNGDAHLKNFSLMETEQGDYILSPAYDLICTALHISDSAIALRDGLYVDDWKESTFQHYGFYTRHSFVLFAEKIGINQKIADKILNECEAFVSPSKDMITRSYLSDEAKSHYIEIITDRLKRFKVKQILS